MPAFKPLFYFPLFFLLFTTCTKEPITETDPIVGEWTIHSFIDEDGSIIVWKDTMDRLIAERDPNYSCMEYTASITSTLVSTKYLYKLTEASECLDPIFTAHKWKKTNSTDQYEFKVGDNITQYTVTFSESDQRMEWKDNATNNVTIWIRQ